MVRFKVSSSGIRKTLYPSVFSSDAARLGKTDLFSKSTKCSALRENTPFGRPIMAGYNLLPICNPPSVKLSPQGALNQRKAHAQ
jgi:hypothetical protein